MSAHATDDQTRDPEYDAHLAAFEARIAAGEKIEPTDWMPDEYRLGLLRIISQHAHSEIVGELPEGGWIPYAPSLRRKLTLISKVQDEAGHGQLLYRAAETLGQTREEMIDELLTGKAKYSCVFNYPAAEWADVGAIGWLIDEAAILNQTMLAQGSYGPYSRAMKRICYEEAFHVKQGADLIYTLATGTPDQKAMAQRSIDRWWYPALMLFGPPDKVSVHTAALMKWKVKTRTNDELRDEFVEKIVTQIRSVGLEVPDRDCYYDKNSGKWHYTQPDWDEFWRVVKGDGPLNAERMAARRKAHEDGLWVREALAAHAAKHAQSNGAR